MKQISALYILVLLLFGSSALADETTLSNTNKVFRVMTYNIRHAEGMDGKIDPGRIAELINREHADIVALQEVDKGMARTQRRDLPAELASLTGMTCVFSNNYSLQGGEYGNAILSRFAVLQATNTHYQMVHESEQRGLLQVTLDVEGRPLIFMATHLHFVTNDESRWSNVGEIESIFKSETIRPVILCGDFNSLPSSRIHHQLLKNFDDTWLSVGKGTGNTIPSEKPNRRIDYIWVSKGGALVPIKARVPASEASDHLPVVAEFLWKK